MVIGGMVYEMVLPTLNNIIEEYRRW
jgi:hypothetical protein